jgi:hypothetical protein
MMRMAVTRIKREKVNSSPGLYGAKVGQVDKAQ